MAMAVIRLARPAAIRPPSAPSLRPTARVLRRLRVVRCRAGGGGGGEGGKGKEEEEGEAAEAPESLFARELRRRGMAPGAAAAGANKEAEEGAPPEAGAKRRVAAAEFERGAAADGQRQRSMALNSEGLEVRLLLPYFFLSHHSLARARAILIGHGQSWLAVPELEDQSFVTRPKSKEAGGTN